MEKTISYRSSQLLNALIDQNKDFFTLKDALDIIKDKNYSTVRKLLSDMTKRGLIMRIMGGLYYRIPYDQRPGSYFPNWHLTAEAMVKPREYYIGFYSALDIHGMITQPSMVEQVVTHEQVKPKVKQVKNVRFEFITLNKDLFFGYRKQWIDDFHKVNYSDLEKTILDCLYMPDYAGGISEITKAIFKSSERMQPDRLLEYLVSFNKQAVYKRFGFVINQLDLFPDLQADITEKITPSYVPLEPSLKKQGHYISKWGIIDNIDFNTVLNYLNT